MSIRNNLNATRLINSLKNSSAQFPALNKEEETELVNKYISKIIDRIESAKETNLLASVNTNWYEALKTNVLNGISNNKLTRIQIIALEQLIPVYLEPTMETTKINTRGKATKVRPTFLNKVRADKFEEFQTAKNFVNELLGIRIEIQNLLIMHNIRQVFATAKKYASLTKQFDDMIGRGIEALCIAADRFDFISKNKFITYATPWVFKYITCEFYDPNIPIENHSISIDQTISVSNNPSDGKVTFENIATNQIDPSLVETYNRSITSQLSSYEQSNLISEIYEFLNNKNRIEFNQNDIEIFNRLVANKESVQAVSADLNIKPHIINKQKNSILTQIKEMLYKKFGISSFEDCVVGELAATI